MKRSKSIFGLIVCLILIQSGCKPEAAYQAPPPPKVTAVKPEIKTIPIYLEENGQTEAVEQAVVFARVRGILKEIRFKPDDEVVAATPETPGTLLFLIEPEEYEAAVKSKTAIVGSAKAEVASAVAAIEVADAGIAAAKAQAHVAKAEFNRIKILKDTNAVSQSELDTAQAKLGTAVAAEQGADAERVAKLAQIENAKAQVKKAEADLEDAQIDLDRTKIYAPISGRLAKSKVKVGNLVENGEPLVEIVKNDPIWANFNISERFLLNLERHSEQDNRTRDLSKIKVQLQRSGDIGFPFPGHLDYYDPTIDQDTGTLQLRAVFENKRSTSNLMPGLFVRVRVQIGEYENALLIPEKAIGRDQVGSFVYVVGNDKKAVRKNVTLGIQHDDMIVIEDGLDQSDSVIVDGILRVRSGIEVDPS